MRGTVRVESLHVTLSSFVSFSDVDAVYFIVAWASSPGAVGIFALAFNTKKGFCGSENRTYIGFLPIFRAQTSTVTHLVQGHEI